MKICCQSNSYFQIFIDYHGVDSHELIPQVTFQENYTCLTPKHITGSCYRAKKVKRVVAQQSN